MKYEVNYYDPINGATSPIDTIEAHKGYTAENYISDCENNADQDWLYMIHNGVIMITPIK